MQNVKKKKKDTSAPLMYSLSQYTYFINVHGVNKKRRQTLPKFQIKILGPVQMLYFTWAESNANERSLLFSFIGIRFGSCEVRHDNIFLVVCLCILWQGAVPWSKPNWSYMKLTTIDGWNHWLRTGEIRSYLTEWSVILFFSFLKEDLLHLRLYNIKVKLPATRRK